MEEAKRMYEQLEEWYDAHPQASFGELEAESRKRRRELIGKARAQLVNGRDTGAQVELPICKQCVGKMEFEGYRDWGIHGLEGDSILERTYYVCPDGGMILLREEGWKEVKMSVISEAKPKATTSTKPAAAAEVRVLLIWHSYQAGLWNADEMEQHQYLEEARRQVALSQRLSSVNDGAPWIVHITTNNCPQAIQIIDWYQADERLWKVSKAAFSEGTRPLHNVVSSCEADALSSTFKIRTSKGFICQRNFSAFPTTILTPKDR